jgi:uncharacterized protein (TIGR03083 family)
MDKSEWLAALQQEGSAFASMLVPATLSTPVRSCPGWTIADLGRHLGGIHRWARHAILHGPSEEPVGPDDPAALRGWYQQALDDLLSTLQDSQLQDPCWTFADPPVVGFWARRQAHETTLHRWDAASSHGQPPPIAESLAEDGIDEVVTMFVPRQLRLNRLEPGPETVLLACASGRSFTVVRAAAETVPAPDAVVTGTAEALLLLLWGRISLSDRRLVVTGDTRAAAHLLSQPLTP